MYVPASLGCVCVHVQKTHIVLVKDTLEVWL